MKKYIYACCTSTGGFDELVTLDEANIIKDTGEQTGDGVYELTLRENDGSETECFYLDKVEISSTKTVSKLKRDELYLLLDALEYGAEGLVEMAEENVLPAKGKLFAKHMKEAREAMKERIAKLKDKLKNRAKPNEEESE